MASPGRKRHYRRYLEPGQPSTVPRQTLCNRRKNRHNTADDRTSAHDCAKDDRAPVDHAADDDHGSADDCASDDDHASVPPPERTSAHDCVSPPESTSADDCVLSPGRTSAGLTNFGSIPNRSAEQDEQSALSGSSELHVLCSPSVSELSDSESMDLAAEDPLCLGVDLDSFGEPCIDEFFDCQETPGCSSEEPGGIDDEEARADTEDEDTQAYFKRASEETLPHQTTTKAQAVLLILTLVVSGGFSWTQVDGILKLINTLFGTEVVPDSKYMFRKLWKQKMNMITFHYYCHTCFSYLGIRASNISPEERLTCESCDRCYNPRTLIADGHFFLTFSVKRQLQSLLSALAGPLYTTLKRTLSGASGVYTDIFDGRLYKSIRRQMNMTWSDVTVTLNTDGSPVFNSSKASVWPIQVLLNELPINVRFRNVIVGGLWFAKVHPPAHLFMRTFVEEFRKIGSIIWMHAGDRVISRVFAVCCSVDSPARAVLLNMKQFNGYFGCSWCLERGTLVDGTYS